MSNPTAIRNARLRHRDKPTIIRIDDRGNIHSIEDDPGGDVLLDEIDAAGCVVLPSFIDVHLHLDLAYSLDLVPANESGTLSEAISHWAEAKKTLTAQNVCRRALRAIAEEIGFGTGRIRTHVDVGTAAGLRLAEGVLDARRETKNQIDVQIVAFPQDGLIQDPGAYEQMADALRMGCDLVGGIAHNEPTPNDSRRHVDMLFDLAEKFDSDIDCHIDETDDPKSRCTEYLAAQTIARGWQGRVTASHVCALAGYEDEHASKVIDLLASANVHVVTNPGVNLHLQGRGDRYPKRRGLTRVTELMAAGVNVSAGQDCIRDPFYPLGTGNMLEVGNLLIHADHMSTPERIEQVCDAITTNPARAMGDDRYGLAPGNPADLVVLKETSLLECFRLHRRPAWVLKRGVVQN